MLKGTILLIDDTRRWYDTILFILHEEGYEVVWSPTRELARHVLGSGCVINIVMVNLNLIENSPILDGTGYLMLEELERDWPQLPKIALSSFGDPLTSTAAADKVVELYTRYKVRHVAIKNGHNFAGNLVLKLNEITSERALGPGSVFELAHRDRTDLVERLGGLPSWENGQHQERIGILLAAGLPKDYVRQWILDGSPNVTAALVVNGLENVGVVISAPEYRALGLLVKYLYSCCPDAEGKRFYAEMILRYCMTTDQEWLETISQYLASQ